MGSERLKQQEKQEVLQSEGTGSRLEGMEPKAYMEGLVVGSQDRRREGETQVRITV